MLLILITLPLLAVAVDDWDAVGRVFCEGIRDGYPEWFNSITAIIFITPVSLWGLYASQVKYDILRIIYVCLAWNGPSSFLRHHYGFNFYGTLDTMTINVAAWLLLVFAARALILYVFDRITFDSDREVMQAKREDNYWYADIFLDNVPLVCIGLMFFLMANDTVHGRPWGIDVNFADGFALCQILTTAICVVLCILHRDHTAFVIYCSVGLLYLLAAVLMWISTEPQCIEHKTVRNDFEYYTHGIWHLASIHSSHLIIQCICYANLISMGKPARFRSGDYCFTKAVYTVLPIVEAVPLSERRSPRALEHRDNIALTVH